MKIQTAAFDAEVLANDGPVVVDFYADWCGPCKMQGPILDELSAKDPSIKICKVNIDEEPTLASRFGVMSIPTLLVFKKGEQSAKAVGLTNLDKLLEMVK